MKNQNSYSHGLLYSVAPEDIVALHLLDEDERDKLDWQADNPQAEPVSLVRKILGLWKSVDSM